MKTAEKIFSFIKKFLGYTGFYFTVVVMAFNAFLTLGDTYGNKVFKTEMFWWILLFSAVYALCNFILDCKFIESYFARIAIHYVLIVLDFALVMAYGSGAASSSKGMVLVIIAFAFAYLVVEAVRGVIYGVTHKKKNEKEEYSTLFTK